MPVCPGFTRALNRQYHSTLLPPEAGRLLIQMATNGKGQDPQSWRPHRDGHAHQHSAPTPGLSSKCAPKVKNLTLVQQESELLSQLRTSRSAHPTYGGGSQYQPHWEIGTCMMETTTQRQAVILTEPAPRTVETAQQRWIAVWGHTYRSFNEMQF